ncbi:derlin-1 [Tetranychus urticae]|uniref:Derlin n=1 Tax=Tetranychus urticae TaxID=32264 RepID=T1KU58_TETUR|nr:derlin-1 [Tetranychus urticae]
MSEIIQWFDSLPKFTRYWFGLSVVFPIVGKFGIFSPMSVVLTPQFISQFQIWRPFTATFYYPTGFHYLMNLYFLYNYSLRLETGPEFASKPAEYLFLLIFNWFWAVVIGYLFSIPLLMDPMVLSVLYIWCQFNKETVVSFWFGIRVKAMYLPFVLLGFNVLMGGSAYFEILGIIIGHLYYFTMVKYPAENGVHLISPPQILYDYFPNIQGRVGGFTYVPPTQPQPTSERRHNWGRGFTLGGT